MFAFALALAFTFALAAPGLRAGDHARRHRGPTLTEAAQNSTCPSGNVKVVSSRAQADYSIRFVNSRATADCVVRWVSVAPGPGHWREVSSFPDFRIYVTDGIADLTVLAE